MIRRIVSRRQLDKEPYQLWNAFVELLATETYSDLTVEQRPAHLVFWYESEVQNGGHLQYFENQTIQNCLRIEETIVALGKLGADCQQEILRDAGSVWLNRSRDRIQTVEVYCEVALQGEFDAFDTRFGECVPTLCDFLNTHLAQNGSLFVEISE